MIYTTIYPLDILSTAVITSLLLNTILFQEGNKNFLSDSKIFLYDIDVHNRFLSRFVTILNYKYYQ